MSNEILKRTLCVEFTEFPDVDEAWLEDRAKEIGETLMRRLRGKLEWGQIFSLPARSGIGLALLMFRGHEHDETIVETVFEIVCEKTGIDLKKSGKQKRRKGGFPSFGLGPRFPAEFYESRGRNRSVSPVIHLDHGAGQRSGNSQSGREGA